MEKVILKIIETITDPLALVLLVVVGMLYKLLLSKETQLTKLTTEVHKNGVIIAQMMEMLKHLVYGRKGD